MQVGDKVIILPTTERKRFADVLSVDALPAIKPPMAKVMRDRANGQIEWVPLWNLQAYLYAPAPEN